MSIQSEPMIGRVAMELSPESLETIARMVAADLAQRQQLTDEALTALKQQDTAKLLGVDAATLVAWERDGRLVPFIREGKIIRYSRQQIAAFMNRDSR